MKKIEKVKIDELTGVIHHVKERFIVCCHGLYSNKDSKKYLQMAEIANSVDISCIRFDFRGCGESGGDFSYNLKDKVSDLKKIIEYITKKYGKVKFALFGSSFGGMVAIEYAAMNKVSSLAVVATPYKVAFGKYKVNISHYVEKCSHMLVMHGKNDELISHSHAITIYKKSHQPKKLRLFDTDHSFSDEKDRHEAVKEAIKWIKKYF